MSLKTFKYLTCCIIVQAITLIPSIATANVREAHHGVIDEALPQSGSKQAIKQIQKQVKKEQRELAKSDRQELKTKAKKGERLAQVALGADFAREAQMLTFAPIAANDALSDALRWYAVAAKRGYPGAPSLDTSGVSFYPVRVIRNK